ncbi:hypothetical protein SmJEL517_g01562 [Synchytrium microbalum]|uniref:RING-type domain-containing protein n=1 Tax=Synchytrium microbalum TaxID=1806994 RepID=A0A507CA49_9FUNG|nr:uncharacterized protein SmJEL517_g01562 [Synchytrium microbalum]TPX36218.1 hypothetical protein SmJEL517_g01562 [Synchytrium microbalum]
MGNALARVIFRQPENPRGPPQNSGLMDDRDPFVVSRTTYFGPFFIVAGGDNVAINSNTAAIWSSLLGNNQLTDAEMRNLRGTFNEALVNLHRDSLRVISDPPSSTPSPNTKHKISFEFDAAVPCQIRIYQSCKEVAVIGPSGSRSTIYKTSSGGIAAPIILGSFPVGLNQTCTSSALLDASSLIDDGIDEVVERIPQVVISDGASSVHAESANRGKRFPLIIVIEGANAIQHAEPEILPCATQSTFVSLATNEHGMVARVAKQKIMIEGISYLVQEVFGFTDSQTASPTDNPTAEQTAEDNSTRECVVCLSELKNTVVLPCRHLCLCTTCANVLRTSGRSTAIPASYSSRAGPPKCPICRQPFYALLQLNLPDEDEAEDEVVVEADRRRRPSISDSVRSTVKQALDAGYECTVLVRTPSKLSKFSENEAFKDKLKVVQGNVFNESDVERAMDGGKVVVVNLGADKAWYPESDPQKYVRSKGTANIISAMKKAGITKVFLVSAIGCGPSSTGYDRLSKVAMVLMMNQLKGEHELQEEMLIKSDLDYIIIKPPWLKDGAPTGKYKVGEGIGGISVDREDIAKFIADTLNVDTYNKRRVNIQAG